MTMGEPTSVDSKNLETQKPPRAEELLARLTSPDARTEEGHVFFSMEVVGWWIYS